MKNTNSSSTSTDILLTVISNFSILLSSFLQTALLLRILTLESYGIYAIFTTSFALGLSFCMFGIDKTVARLISKNKEKYTKLVGEIFLFILVLALISSLFFYLFLAISSVYLFNNPNLMKYLQYAVIGIFLAIFSTFLTSVLQGLSEIKRIAIMSIFTRLIGLLAAVILIFTLNLFGGILAYILYYIFELVLLTYIIFRIKSKYNFKFNLRFEKKTFVLLIKTGSAYYVLTMIVTFTFWLGIALLNRIAGLTEVGLYQVGQYIFAILQQIGYSLVFVLFPKISSISETESKSKQNLQNFINRIIRISFSFQFLLGLSFLMLQDIFLILFNLEEEARSIIIAFIFIAPLIFGVGFIIIDTTLFGMSEFKILIIIRIIFLLTYIITALIAIPLVGSLGLVLSMLSCWIAQMGIGILYLWTNYFRIEEVAKNILKIFLILMFYIFSYSFLTYIHLNVFFPLNWLFDSIIFISALIFTLFIILSNEDRMRIKTNLTLLTNSIKKIL
jgi:O-antigen/teichoic acid export membrane protein